SFAFVRRSDCQMFGFMSDARCAAFFTLWLAAGAPGSEAQRPNVVLILADDLGYTDVGCYGGKIPTPHIDRLAAQGVRFTDAHSSSSVCTPTRYGLLTGRYNWQIGRASCRAPVQVSL